MYRLYVLAAQRKCMYPGQYAMEILEVADWQTAEDENPEWLVEKYEYYYQSKEFTHLKWIPLDVSEKELENKLFGNTPIVAHVPSES